MLHAECYDLLRGGDQGKMDSCANFPDPRVPIGVSLSMVRSSEEFLDYKPDGFQNGMDGVAFIVRSENMIQNCVGGR
jgi:hypothetical protein